MRDKLIHDYFGVDLELAWDVVVAELPNARALIVGLLAEWKPRVSPRTEHRSSRPHFSVAFRHIPTTTPLPKRQPSAFLSKSEWIAQADEICQAADEDEDVAAWNKKLDRLNESGLNDPEEVAEFAAILRQVLPKSEQGIRELRELEPPSGDSHAIEAVLEKDEETLGLIKETAREMEKVMSQRQNSFPSKRPCPIGPLSGWRSAMTSSSAGSKSSRRLPADR